MGTSSKVTSLSMLAFATLASLLAVSSAQVTCDECKTAGAAMVARLTGEESIAEQVAVLVGTLCPGAEDPAGCEAGIPTAWPEIATAMYPVFLILKLPALPMMIAPVHVKSPVNYALMVLAVLKPT